MRARSARRPLWLIDPRCPVKELRELADECIAITAFASQAATLRSLRDEPWEREGSSTCADKATLIRTRRINKFLWLCAHWDDNPLFFSESDRGRRSAES